MLRLAPMLRRVVPGMLLLASFIVLAAARSTHSRASSAPKLTLTSTAFAAGGGIPAQYTCDGPGISPPLAWSGIPAGTKSLALIVDDPDAPDPKAPTTTWVHWVLYDIPPSATDLPQNVGAGSLPQGAKAGKNGWKRMGYGGPCPPVGRHRYFFKLYALNVVLPDLNGPDEAQLAAAMRGHIVGQAQLIGTYEKAK